MYFFIGLMLKYMSFNYFNILISTYKQGIFGEEKNQNAALCEIQCFHCTMYNVLPMEIC
jgi:hypothetical protein